MESKIPVYDEMTESEINKMLESSIEQIKREESVRMEEVIDEIEEPNETTYKAMDDAENHRNMYGPFNTIEELMTSLNS